VEDLRRRLGKRLRALRGDLPQAELAELAGLSQQAISGIERGERMPGLDTAFLLAQGLGVDMNELVLTELQEIQERREQYQADRSITRLIDLFQELDGEWRDFVLDVLQRAVELSRNGTRASDPG